MNSFDLLFLEFQQPPADAVAEVLCLDQPDMAFWGVGAEPSLPE